MAISYRITKLKNPIKPDEPEKYYARETDTRRVDLDEVARNISRHSTTVGEADVRAVLTVLGDEIADLLEKGCSVHLGDLGSFRATLQSKGVESEKDVNSSIITGAKVRFSAGKKLEASLARAEFKKAESKKAEGAEG